MSDYLRELMSLSLEALRRGMGGWETFKLQYMHMMKTTIVHVCVFAITENNEKALLVSFCLLFQCFVLSVRPPPAVCPSSLGPLVQSYYPLCAPVLHHRRWL